jgi:hypothetical protein
MDLILPLKKKWFEAIKDGSKDFEYRLDTEYWRKRLVGKTFDSVVFTLGYPKSHDQDRRIIRPWAGYEMQTIIHEEWGEIQQRVFAIRIIAPLNPDFVQREGEKFSEYLMRIHPCPCCGMRIQ